MKLQTVIAETILILIFAASVQAAQTLTNPPAGPVKSLPSGPVFEQRFTPAVVEANGFLAVCSATNLDSVNRDLAAQIIDSTGADITETSSCGVRQGPGVTCRSTAHFRNNSALRCVVSTTGTAANLRGAMVTSAGPSSPANLTIPAQ